VSIPRTSRRALPFWWTARSDIPISPPMQPASATGLQSIAAYYSAVPVGVIKVKGTLIGPTHCDVQGVPTCTPTTVPCFLGVYGYLGYPKAWMMFQLQNENLAGGAFVNGDRKSTRLNSSHVEISYAVF